MNPWQQSFFSLSVISTGFRHKAWLCVLSFRLRMVWVPHTAPGRSAEWSHVGPLMLVFICLYIYISWYLLLDCNILLWLLMLTREWAEWLYTLLWNVHIYQLATEKWSTLFLFFLHRRDVAFLDQFPALWNKALLSIWWSRSILLELARGEPPALQQKGSYASSIRV